MKKAVKRGKSKTKTKSKTKSKTQVKDGQVHIETCGRQVEGQENDESEDGPKSEEDGTPPCGHKTQARGEESGHRGGRRGRIGCSRHRSRGTESQEKRLGRLRFGQIRAEAIRPSGHAGRSPSIGGTAHQSVWRRAIFWSGVHPIGNTRRLLCRS